ncbi:MAG: tetratricopeptide repeat protein [Candidatus Ornithospirochaeta sp.]|nr:tetratricopeptide repeat protein [Sphaerochaetaceae bacterium]MDY5524056.1 tetratricopeptide repeat protein [Candidatus Ornithospirochaeta sp.]
MAKNKDKEVQLTASEKMTQSVDSWLGRHIKLIASIVIAVVAVIVIAAIVTVVVNNNQSKRYEKLDAVTASYAEFSAMDGDAEGYAEAKNNVIAGAEELAKNPKNYPGAKANLILADMAFDDGDYNKAIELYSLVASSQTKTFLREVALMSLAASYEENGDKAAALKVYNDFFDEYDTESFYSSRALFNAARLTEETDKALAISIYEQLIAYFESYNSEYAKLAKSRVAQLN